MHNKLSFLSLALISTIASAQVTLHTTITKITGDIKEIAQPIVSLNQNSPTTVSVNTMDFTFALLDESAETAKISVKATEGKTCISDVLLIVNWNKAAKIKIGEVQRTPKDATTDTTCEDHEQFLEIELVANHEKAN